MKMELNYFKEILFDLVNESDKLAVLDIEEDYNNNTMIFTMPDGRRILMECRTIE
jgi:hypothetical protein